MNITTLKQQRRKLLLNRWSGKLTVNRASRTARRSRKLLRIDPTRTVSLRRSFVAQVNREFGKLKASLVKLMLDEDAFGLLADRRITGNANPEGCNQHTGPGCGGTSFTVGDEVQWVGDPSNPFNIKGAWTIAEERPNGMLRIVKGGQSKVISKENLSPKSRSMGTVPKLPDKGFIDEKEFFASSSKSMPAGLAKEITELERGGGTLQLVDVKSLVPTQDYTGADKVRGIADQWDSKKASPVQIIEKDGFKYIYDGHHTAAAAALKAGGRVSARVVTANSSGDNCGTGAGGFQPGNTCGAGGGSSFGTQKRTTLVELEPACDPAWFFPWLTLNTRWRFDSQPAKVQAFQRWLRKQMGESVRGARQEEVWKRYVEEGFRKGAGRAFDDARGSSRWAPGEGAFYKGSKREFLRSAFGQPESVEKVKLLAGRTFDELDNITRDMSNKISRVLTDGLVQGKHPKQIAKEMAKQVDIGRSRAQTIAQTEIIRAHAAGQLAAFRNLGVAELGVAVEWATAQDDAVCTACQPLEGAVFSIDEAEGMIPRHPRCRCAFKPAGLGEKSDKQTWSKEGLEAAIEASLEAKDDGWGPAVEIDEDRPEPLVNASPSLLGFSALKTLLVNEGDNCGTGAGGFQPGNTCAKGGGDARGDSPAVLKRLKMEWEQYSPKAERAMRESLGSMRDGTASTWDDLDESTQEELKEKWVDDNYESYLSLEIDSIHDSLGYKLRRDEDLAEEAVNAWMEEESIDGWKYGGLSKGNISLKPADPPDDWNEEEDGAWEPEPISKSEWGALKDKRDELIQAKIDDAVENDAPSNAKSHAENAFDELGEDELNSLAEGSNTSTIVEEPNAWKPYQNGRDYQRTRAVLLAVQEKLTADLITERGLEVPIGADKAPARVARDLWSAWKKDSHSDGGKLLQWATAEELGGHSRLTEADAGSINKAAASLAKKLGLVDATEDDQITLGKEVTKAHARATWAASQLALSKAGLEEETVYRGLLLDRKAVADSLPESERDGVRFGAYYRKLPNLTLQKNAAASTAAGEEGRQVANSWNGVGKKPQDAVRVVLRITVPRESILSIPAFGQNIHSEREVVVAGTHWKKWDAYLNRAPEAGKEYD